MVQAIEHGPIFSRLALKIINILLTLVIVDES